MAEKNHYFSQYPNVNLKINTVAESLRRHLYIFKTVTGVFSFKKIDLGTKVLIEHMIIPQESGNLLDLGCGYGPIGIVLAYKAPNSLVYLIDINKRAIWCAKENIKINISNYKKRVFALSGDYFKAIENKDLKFDAIYMNPPLRVGKKPFLELCSEVSNHLKERGYFEFVIKKKMGAQSIYESLKDIDLWYDIEILCKRSGYWVFNLTF
jgi:16S rRNA (guanine1207-N2)-methyltransferase